MSDSLAEARKAPRASTIRLPNISFVFAICFVILRSLGQALQDPSGLTIKMFNDHVFGQEELTRGETRVSRIITNGNWLARGLPIPNQSWTCGTVRRSMA